MQTTGREGKNIVLCPFPFSSIVLSLLMRFVLPVDVLSLSQEKERNSLNIDKFLFLQTVIKYFAP